MNHDAPRAQEPAVDLTELFRLDGRVALVTGGSSGLGARAAQVLHAAGASVAVAARRLERLEELAAGMERVTPFGCDVSDAGQCRDLVQAVLERHGRLDILVNNAGIATGYPAESEPPEEFRRVLDVNLHGAFQLSQLAATSMLERGSGVIVNVASIIGLVGIGQIPQASYAASKGAVLGLTRELAAQWARRGIRVNAVAPGWFPTEMNTELFAEESFVRWVRSRTPLGRAGQPQELDGALLFLASDASSFITGQVLVVDGGWTCV
jgi:NAD(P)-dependent dehydrogenase (short-subunit alcohol dehydrogenase family)